MSGNDPGGTGDGGGLETIPRDECLQLLATESIGRVAVADFGAAPLVVPVNFLVDGDGVVFRTDYGSKFRLAVLGEQPVSFEVDAIDPERQVGWSVLLQGYAREMDDVDWSRLSVHPWVTGVKDHFVRIAADSISGRRIRPRQSM